MVESVFHTADECRAASMRYFDGDELAVDAFVRKYALRRGLNEFLELTPADMHVRLARNFARMEAKYPNPMTEQEIFCLLADVDLVALERDEAVFDLNELSLEELKRYDRGYGRVLAQGSPMSGIGDPYRFQSLSNCFVIDPPHDSYGGIFKTDEEGAQIMKRRGGVGNDVSTLRWKGAATKNAAGTSDGVTLFCDRFSNTTREVAQGGRRGARMLTNDVRHPDIHDFILMKQDLKRVTGANVSIRIYDEFMRAVEDEGTYEQAFPCEPEAWSSAPEHVRLRRQVQAGPIWDTITSGAWCSAEPGVLFWDTWLRRTPADAYAAFGFRTVSTNPCAELGMCPYDSCRLMVINLYKFVIDRFMPTARFDWHGFAQVVRQAQRLMDDLVDLEIEAIDRIIAKVESDPEPEETKRVELELWRKVRIKAVQGRRTGLGPTGVGDCLAALGVKYGSPESIELTEQIYRALTVESYRSSCVMARERGAFPIYDWELEKDHVFLRQVREADPFLDALWRAHGRRNIANTTTAPNGTGATQAQVTSGIEPAFLLELKRRRKLSHDEVAALESQGRRPDFVDATGDCWQEYVVHHHAFRHWMEATGLTDPKDSPWWGATSADVDWVASVDLQGAAQRWVCHSISKTVNLPADATVETVKQVYMRAWKVGCKGITVYRDGSRDGVLLAADGPKKQEGRSVLVQTQATKRPKGLVCDVHHTQITTIGIEPGWDEEHSEGPAPLKRLTEHYIVLVGLMDDRPYEVFCGLAKNVEIPRRHRKGELVKSRRVKGVATYDLRIDTGDADDPLVFKNVVELFDDPEGGAVTRMASLALRHGVPVQHVVEQLQKDKHSEMHSLTRVVARILKDYIPDGTAVSGREGCPDCGAQLLYKEGCVGCSTCTFSRCG